MSSSSVLMPLPGESPRDFAVRYGLAKPTRGRMSQRAHDAIDAARAAGAVFVEPTLVPVPRPKVAAAPKPVVMATPRPNPAGSYDPKAVRKWAEREGLVPAGRRGRLPGEVISKYLSTDAGKVAQRATPATVAAIARTRKESAAYVVERGKTVAITRCAEGSKGGCGKQVQSCTHPAPIAPHWLSEGIAGQPMSLVKPLV